MKKLEVDSLVDRLQDILEECEERLKNEDEKTAPIVEELASPTLVANLHSEINRMELDCLVALSFLSRVKSETVSPLHKVFMFLTSISLLNAFFFSAATSVATVGCFILLFALLITQSVVYQNRKSDALKHTERLFSMKENVLKVGSRLQKWRTCMLLEPKPTLDLVRKFSCDVRSDIALAISERTFLMYGKSSSYDSHLYQFFPTDPQAWEDEREVVALLQKDNWLSVVPRTPSSILNP